MAKNSTYLYGKNSILERLRVNPKSIKRILLQENFNSPYILNLIESNGIPMQIVGERELVKTKKADRLQGIVAEVARFSYMDFDELIQKKGLSLIFLDNISDPHNLGSILRITACLGNFGVIIPKHSSCEVNDTVMHVASGGENFTPVSTVNNMSVALTKAKKRGFWIVGTVVEKGEDINSVSLPFPICLVLGSEGKGIRHGIEKQLDSKITLPMKGVSLSLNVAMACAIFCYEIDRQRTKK